MICTFSINTIKILFNGLISRFPHKLTCQNFLNHHQYIDEETRKKIANTYNRKYIVEDDFKVPNDALLVPIGSVNHHKDFNIRTHVFLCILGMLFIDIYHGNVNSLI